ncbi:MAG: NADH-quinone oxidoreductase subunit J [Bdellovibrionota bacterium]
MTLLEVMTFLFMVLCVLSATYIAFARDLLRSSIAFFVELFSVSGVLLSLKADYLALAIFGVALMGTVLLLYFASVVSSNLREVFRQPSTKASTRHLTRGLGVVLGIAVGVSIAWAFLSVSKLRPVVGASQSAASALKADVHVLGDKMLTDHLAVFELFGVLVLLTVVGTGLLLRKPDDAN